MIDSAALAELIAELVGDHVERATSPLIARIAALESRSAPAVDMDAIERLVEGAVAALPAKGAGGDMEALVAAAVSRAVEALPPAAAGKDGVGVAGAVIDRNGSLVLTLSDGAICNLGTVVGEPGRDGFSLEHFDTKWDGERTLTLTFNDGRCEFTHEIHLPLMLYRDVYSDGTSYEAGDSVTWGGSLWIAQRDTNAKPDGPDSGWRLAVKRGRDGKDKA